MPQPPVITLKVGYRCGAHGKLAYVTEDEAEEALAGMERYPGRKIPTRAYKPTDGRCIYWHLTSKPLRRP